MAFRNDRHTARVGGALQLRISTKQPPDRELPDLARLTPENLLGWTMKKLPLAKMEEVKNDVASTLQFNRYVSRSYTRGAAIVTIYVVYWCADKVPPGWWACIRPIHAGS
jgi:hypothetical protein